MEAEQAMSDDYNADPYDLEGQEALLQSPELVPLGKIKQAADLTKQQLMAKWLNSKPEDEEERERIFKEIHLVDRVFSNLQNNINS